MVFILIWSKFLDRFLVIIGDERKNSVVRSNTAQLPRFLVFDSEYLNIALPSYLWYKLRQTNMDFLLKNFIKFKWITFLLKYKKALSTYHIQFLNKWFVLNYCDSILPITRIFQRLRYCWYILPWRNHSVVRQTLFFFYLFQYQIFYHCTLLYTTNKIEKKNKSGRTSTM